MTEDPFYPQCGDEVDVFMTVHWQRLQVMSSAPKGFGKTCFVEHMASRLGLPSMSALRSLVGAAPMMNECLPAPAAVRVGMLPSLCDDAEIPQGLREEENTYLPE